MEINMETTTKTTTEMLSSTLHTTKHLLTSINVLITAHLNHSQHLIVSLLVLVVQFYVSLLTVVDSPLSERQCGPSHRKWKQFSSCLGNEPESVYVCL